MEYVLVGTHAFGGWMRKPRTAPSVDVLVPARSHERAVRALLATFPSLHKQAEGALTRLLFTPAGEGWIDVLRPHSELRRVTFEHTHSVRADELTYEIPSLEASLAWKFEGLVTRPWSDADKYQDAHDFLCMLGGDLPLDYAKLARLGDAVCPGGGADLVAQVRRVRAGQKLQL